ncbi:MAG: MGMT family protein [Muribaculaceae bacterium]|nr:MGMT family protein [Muribaculaceae bacterium]
MDLDFAREVKEVVRLIPAGRVSTYGDVAALAGMPGRARLVGRILGMIGPANDVPCHRVVNAQGRCAPHWPSQAALLRAEGVTFRPNGNVDLAIHKLSL